MDIKAFLDQIKFTGLDESLYGAAIVLAVLLRFGCAAWSWFDKRHVILAALLMGVGGSWLMLSMDKGKQWQMITGQGLALTVALLILETLLRKVPFLPADNAYVPNAPGPQPVATEGGK